MNFAELMNKEINRKRKYIEDKNVLKVCALLFVFLTHIYGF